MSTSQSVVCACDTVAASGGIPAEAAAIPCQVLGVDRGDLIVSCSHHHTLLPLLLLLVAAAAVCLCCCCLYNAHTPPHSFIHTHNNRQQQPTTTQMDFLEHPSITDVIVCRTVVEEVRQGVSECIE